MVSDSSTKACTVASSLAHAKYLSVQAFQHRSYLAVDYLGHNRAGP